MKKQHFAQIAETWDQVFKKWSWRILMTADPLFGQVGESPIYEGEVIEATQEVNVTDSKLHRVEGRITIGNDPIRHTDLQAFEDALTNGILDFGKNRHDLFFSQLSTSLERAGQTRDAGGRPLTWETFLELLEMVDFNFDEQGNWIPPTIMANPAHIPAIDRIQNEIQADPAKKKRLEELIQRKHEAFNAKEDHRTLVD